MSYKINFNRKKLSDQEVQSNMNFDEFMQGYQAAGTASGSFLNGIKFYTIIGASGLVMLGGYLAYKGFGGSGSSNSSMPFVSPPIEGAGVQLSSFNINTQRDTAVVYNTGSSIVIPANAFLDKNKKPVSGNVELRYREFHDPFEVLLSGIPMHYDSAGEHYNFESAGMIEILAYKDGNLLYTNPDAPIKINMLSYNNEDKFNLYYLDTVARRWEYEGKNSMANGNFKPLYDPTIAKEYLQEAIKELEQQMPEKANPSRYSFVIDYNKTEFPELAMFEDVKFEVDKNDGGYDPKYAQRVWQDVSISKGADKRHYTIQFSNETESHSFSVKPVLEGLKYEDVKLEMESKLIDYQIALQKGKLEKKQQMDVLMSRYQRAVKTVEWNNINGYVNDYLKQDRVNIINLSARTFDARVFGIWNMDIPFAVRMEYKPFKASFTDASGSPIDLKDAWVVEPDGHRIIRFSCPESETVFPMRFKPGVRSLLIARTAGKEKLAYINCEQFQKAVREGANAVLALTVSEKSIHEPEELKAALGM